MILKKNSYPNWQLYAVIDRKASGNRDFSELTNSVIKGGADVIQLRDKISEVSKIVDDAKKCLLIAREAGIPLIINDSVDIASEIGADGVHLGQDDMKVSDARERLKSGQLIGQSTHSLKQARDAFESGADYIGFGPIFSTPTKPDYRKVGTDHIMQVRKEFTGPVVCIGGIDKENIYQVLEAGASCVAVVRAICASSKPEAAANELKQALQEFDYAKCSGL